MKTEIHVRPNTTNTAVSLSAPSPYMAAYRPIWAYMLPWKQPAASVHSTQVLTQHQDTNNLLK